LQLFIGNLVKIIPIFKRLITVVKVISDEEHKARELNLTTSYFC